MKNLGVALLCMFGLFWLGMVLALDIKFFNDIVGWLIASLFLYVAFILLELYWNLFDWTPNMTSGLRPCSLSYSLAL